MSTQALTADDKARIRAEYRGQSAIAERDPLAGGRFGDAHVLNWRRLRAERIAAYEARHGRPYDPAEDQPDYQCAMCQDSGSYVRTTGDTSSRVPCPCGAEQEWPAWDPAAARIPIALRPRYTVWKPDQAARDAATAWVAQWPPADPFFTLMGEPGNGKSQLACTMLAEIHERHHQRVAFWGVVEILDRLKATFNEYVEPGDADPTGRVMAELVGQQVLCLDDLGSAKPTEWAEERLYAIIEARLSAQRPTIITCNPSGPGWDGLQPRLKSRVRAGVTVRMTGPDRRLRR